MMSCAHCFECSILLPLLLLSECVLSSSQTLHWLFQNFDPGYNAIWPLVIPDYQCFCNVDYLYLMKIDLLGLKCVHILLSVDTYIFVWVCIVMYDI